MEATTRERYLAACRYSTCDRRSSASARYSLSFKRSASARPTVSSEIAPEKSPISMSLEARQMRFV